MAVPVGLNVWSRLTANTFPYLDQTAGPFDSLWFPDHVQYNGYKVAEGWSLLAYALARYSRSSDSIEAPKVEVVRPGESWGHDTSGKIPIKQAGAQAKAGSRGSPKAAFPCTGDRAARGWLRLVPPRRSSRRT